MRVSDKRFDKGERVPMRVEPVTNVKAFVIYEGPRLDPVTVILQDYGVGAGRLIVECYGEAWSTYWGGMGNKRIDGFIRTCSTDYIANRLWPSSRKRLKKDPQYAYLTRVVDAVQAAMSQSKLEAKE